MNPRTPPPFRLGINYWPARTAMAFWRSFSPAEVAEDFARLSASRFDSVRLFLTWEDFQPAPGRVDRGALERLLTTMDMAADEGLSVMPTLFTGHMSGVNWIPPWALASSASEGEAGDARFRVVSGRRVVTERLRNWYSDEGILREQAGMAGELAEALASHPALWAWDLGNESSNCVIPPDRAHARAWLGRVTGAIRAMDDRAKITTGLHMEDLEHDRQLGPAEAAAYCDFLTMHGYPGYASFTDGPTDERLLPFLARVTSWLGGGADVLFSEFGLPTYGLDELSAEEAEAAAEVLATSSTALVEENDAARYTRRALAALQHHGCLGAMLWCHADYAPSIWGEPPLDQAIHERSFGVFRSDGRPKPVVAEIARFATAVNELSPAARPPDDTWIDIDGAAFYQDPERHLPRLYGRYCAINSPGPGVETPDP